MISTSFVNDVPQTRSAAFDAALQGGGGISVVQAYMTHGGARTLQLFPLPGVTVMQDEAAASRLTLSSLQVVDDGTLAPHLAGDPLAPYGVELELWAGLMIGGTPEVVPLGVYRVNVVNSDQAGLITLKGADRSQVIAAARNEAPYSIAGRTPLDTAIGNYAASKYPAVDFLPDASSHNVLLPPTPTVYQEGASSGDPWTDMTGLASTYGYSLFFNARGSLILQLTNDPSAVTPCWTYSAQQTPGNMGISGVTGFDTSPGKVYNVFIASGNGTATATPGVAPVTAKVEITDPSSPVYANPSGFGRRPFFYSSPLLTTVDQCAKAAQSIANRHLGLDQDITFTAVPHPAHEPGDVVRVQSNLLGIDINCCLSHWSLQADLMKATSYTTRRTLVTTFTP